jgi:transcriptional regulator with GAF, ATPase, and Fis domain
MDASGQGVPKPQGSESAERHFRVLRDLLQRDYLGRADWSYALGDLAEMAKDALGADETLVALVQPDTGTWVACTSEGEMLADAEISAHGSRSVLEHVRQSGQPIHSTADSPLELTSESILQHQLGSVLAIPLRWWDLAESKPAQRFAGCLYAHRTVRKPPFTNRDVELMLDITRVAQPSLNALRHLRDVHAEPEASRQLMRGLQSAAAQRHRLGRYETADPWFADNVLGTLRRIASADKVGLLILGPTGSGKSFLAQSYHYECPRKDGPFVVLDCAQAASEESLAAELFGYAPRSGFANAPPGGRPGAAELAQGGTLFLDEIGTLPRELQQKLLTLIQTGTFSPLGSSEKRQVDLQIIAATKEELAELVQTKQFREDLYWRVSMVTVRLPPLSGRRADIPHLANGFLQSACLQFGRRDVRSFTDSALAALVGFDWSHGGNIRGLEHTVYRSVLLAPPGTRQLDAADLKLQSLAEKPRAGRPSGSPEAAAERQPRSDRASPGRGAESGELAEIQAAIRQHGYATAAAKALGITYDALVWQLRKAGLTVRDVLAR